MRPAEDHHITKIAALLGLGCLLLATACGDIDDDNDLAQAGDTQQSACKPSTKADGAGAGQLKAKAQGDTVTVLHLDAHYNCASRLKLQVTVSGKQILVQEQIINPGELARCMCNYDLSVPVSGLSDGTYQVELFNAEGKLAGSTSVTVSGAGQITVSSTTQSVCKPPPAKTYSTSGLSVSVNGGAVTIQHKDAYYNCAHKLKLTAKLSGTVIEAREVITNPKQGAYCMCHYDLSATVNNVPAGSYTVKLYDADNKLVGSLLVVVP